MSSDFDWQHPDYAPIFRARIERLKRVRAKPSLIPKLRIHYRDNPTAFISDWGCTVDPRNIERGLPALVPFILFQKQIDWINWVIDHWKRQRNGLTEKSREVGLSWLAVSLGCTLCLHYNGVSIGYGSRLVEYVDKIGEPKSLFQKARVFMANLPEEFRGGWTPGHAPHMRLVFPNTGAQMGGEGGDNIGRGDRRSIYFIDEAAHLEHPEMIDAALSQTTHCRIDMSSVHGRANPFAVKRFSGNVDVFTFHWRDDPRKDQAWYDAEVTKIDNPLIVAQELDIDYAASVEGILIPSAWVQAAIDAHTILGFAPTGECLGALDVADEGMDKNAFCGAHGVVVQHLEQWTGKGGDIFSTVQRAFGLCDEHGYTEFRYDADGLGAGVRGDARVINEARLLGRRIVVTPFRGSAEVVSPKSEDVKGRKNEDYFANAKAQAWWSLRTRFLKTFRAVTAGVAASPDEMISLRKDMPNLAHLCVELSQPTYSQNLAGKMLIDKMPEGSASPNLADAVMIRFASVRRSVIVSDSALARVMGRGVATPAAAGSAPNVGRATFSVSNAALERARQR